MNASLADWQSAIATYLPVFARTFAAMMLMPGLGETAIPAIARIGVSAATAAALSPALAPIEMREAEPSITMALVTLSELVTGLWFGWLTRLVAIALTSAGQYAGYMVGLSNVLRSDVDAQSQSDALGSLFGLAAPTLCLVTGLYTLPLKALAGLFNLIPVGHFLPLADCTAAGVTAVGTVFQLSLQLASPFIIFSVLWNLLIGQMSRLAGRMQIYFISFPGQILLGLILVILTTRSIIHAWEHYATSMLAHLPGAS